MGKIYVGDIGTVIELDTGIALSGASPLRIKYEKPDGTTRGYWGATVTDTTKAKYTTVADDLDVSGVWVFQVYAGGLSGWTGHGEEYKRTIYDPEVDAQQGGGL